MEGTLAAIQLQLAELNEQVRILTEQAERSRRRWETVEDLGADLKLVSQGVFEAAVKDFSDLDPYVQLDDSLRLFKRLLENTHNLEWSLQQLESLRDFSRDIGPILNHAFVAFTDGMEELDRKGIISFAREAYRIVDIILSTYTPEDVRLLADNIVLILNTVKEMTQPQIMRLVHNLTDAYRQTDSGEAERPTSTLALLRGMRDPQVRRGLALTMDMLKVIAADRDRATAETETEFETTVTT
jgi:uncharacterized protein YjgD (DUF1641 family)